MNLLKLLFVRHAQSSGNVEKRMQGNAGFELTDEGRQQTEKLARRLLEESWYPTHIYTSPVKRAVQTTEILMAHFLAESLPPTVIDLTGDEVVEPLELSNQEGSRSPIPVIYADELMEFKNGLFEGLTWTEAKTRHPELCLNLEQSLDWIPIPGAETLLEARDRANQFIQTLLHQHTNNDRVLVMTHSWILQHLISVLLGCERSWRFTSRNTAVFEFWIERSRWNASNMNRFNTDLWQIRRFNDSQHLN